MWSFEKFNEVVESLQKEGTRYRTEKFAVIAIYLVLFVVSLVWAFTGIEITRQLEGELTVEKIENIGRHKFTLTNTGNTDWHEVRIVINERYLAEFEKVEAGNPRRLGPEDFQYYYHVPRPWGAEEWERLESSAKPGPNYPLGLDVESLTVRSREGEVEMTVESDS